MKILVTAGPTREAIDPVRFISNKSSGKMGYALAAAAKKRGHQVYLVSGPVCINPPGGVRTVRVVTAEEMLKGIKKIFKKVDVLVMAAAVADWRPERQYFKKIKKRSMSRSIKLVRNPDILEEISPVKGRKILVGFAAETGNPRSEAMRKLKDKGLDMIIGNDVSRADSGFEVDYNRAMLIYPDGRIKMFPRLLKTKLAELIIKEIEILSKK